MRPACALLLALVLSSCIVNIESDPDEHHEGRDRRDVYGSGDV